MPARPAPSNYALLFPYALPFFAYVLVIGRGRELAGDVGGYALAGLAAVAALLWARRWLLPIRGENSPMGSVVLGALAGVLGTALWVALKSPFVEPGGEPWEPDAFAWRLAVSATVVPFVEEWLFRGFLLRGATQWLLARREGLPDPLGHALHERSIHRLPPDTWTAFALIFSSAVFAAGHAPAEWVAALAYGLLMGGLVIWRRDLLCAVVAHGVTNASLALYVRHLGAWNLW